MFAGFDRQKTRTSPSSQDMKWPRKQLFHPKLSSIEEEPVDAERQANGDPEVVHKQSDASDSDRCSFESDEALELKFMDQSIRRSTNHSLPSTLLGDSALFSGLGPALPRNPMCRNPGDTDSDSFLCPSGSGLSPFSKDFLREFVACPMCNMEWHHSCITKLCSITSWGVKYDVDWHCPPCFSEDRRCEWDKAM